MTPSLPWYRRPFHLGLVGLVLMVVGWKVTTFDSLSPRERDSAERFEEIRRMADDPELASRLDRMSRNVQPAVPYLHLGRFVLFAGAAAFVAAVVQMARAPAPAPHDESPDPAPAGADEEEVAER